MHAAFVCPVITVQSRIAKGIFHREFVDWFSNSAPMLATAEPTVAATVESEVSGVVPSIVEAVDWILSFERKRR